MSGGGAILSGVAPLSRVRGGQFASNGLLGRVRVFVSFRGVRLLGGRIGAFSGVCPVLALGVCGRRAGGGERIQADSFL